MGTDFRNTLSDGGVAIDDLWWGDVNMNILCEHTSLLEIIDVRIGNTTVVITYV